MLPVIDGASAIVGPTRRRTFHHTLKSHHPCLVPTPASPHGSRIQRKVLCHAKQLLQTEQQVAAEQVAPPGPAGLTSLTTADQGTSSSSPATTTRATTARQQFAVLQELRGTDVTHEWTLHQSDNTAAGGQQGNTIRDPVIRPVAPEKLAELIKSLFVPDGYPHTTTPDYLPYQSWAAPTHVLGSLAHALTTSSLLQAVGVSAGPVATTAASAAIKWITKDGIGALGRFVVGGSLATEFDKEPRRWRMLAELCTSTGAGLEIATAAFPQHFLVLASLGHLCKAIGKAIGKPVFRVIQTHFAADNNVGAVAAKEEVWEVCAQLTGYAVSLGVLSAVDAVIVEKGGVSSGTELVAIWAAVQSTHICLRYQSLRVLQFSGLNEKRARMLMSDHVAGRLLRNVPLINRLEPIMLPPPLCMVPRVHMGTVSISQVFAAASVAAGATPPPLLRDGAGGTELGVSTQPLGLGSDSGEAAGAGLQGGVQQGVAEHLLRLYADEGHVLVWQGGEALVVVRADAPPTAMLRALWQAEWLHHHTHKGGAAGNGGGAGVADDMTLLAASVRELETRFPLFEQEASAVGWDVSTVMIGPGPIRFQTA